MKLAGKNILFITPKFFNYEIEIKKKLEELGAFVFYFDEKPSNSFITKSLIRLGKKKIEFYLNAYFQNIINFFSDKQLDYIFIIKGETITSHFLKSIKNKFPQTPIILYLWDSIKNYPHIAENVKFFTKISTFDLNDVEQFTDFKFRPLFYLDIFKTTQNNIVKKYDILFIGTAHSDRIRFMKKIESECKTNNLKFHKVLYIQNPILYIFRKIFDSQFKNIKRTEVSFKPLSISEVKDFFNKSKSVIDVQHPKQSGLTMRTFETMGAKTKILTTNKNISKYDFYKPENVLIIDRENPSLNINKHFFDSEFQKLPDDVTKKYSIDGWLNDIFELNKPNTNE